MYLESSRYYRVKQTVTKCAGRDVKVLTLRRLPPTTGKPIVIKENDRLDIMAERLNGDPTTFWHIADANSELYANDLIVTNRVIAVPER